MSQGLKGVFLFPTGKTCFYFYFYFFGGNPGIFGGNHGISLRHVAYPVDFLTGGYSILKPTCFSMFFQKNLEPQIFSDIQAELIGSETLEKQKMLDFRKIKG